MKRQKTLITALSILILTSCAAFAEVATRIPLTVNVVQGCNVTDEEIKEVVKEANKVMKRYLISYEVKKINRNVTGAGTDGKIAAGEEHGLVMNAMNEIKNSDGTYKGMKVFYGNELRNPNYYGMAYHADNGGHWYSVPAVFMKKRPGTTPADYKEKGNDLAHELAHSLTLVGKKPVSTSIDGKSDKWGHLTNPLDSNNLMYQYNGGTGSSRVERGDDLAPEQIKEIKENAKRFGKNYVITPSPELYKMMHPEDVIIYNHEPRMLWVDNPAETYTLPLNDDLAFGYIYTESTTAGMMEIVVNLAGAFQPGIMVDSQLTIKFDTDNNIATGTIEGFDKIINMDLLDIYPTVNTISTLTNYDGSLIDYLPISFLEQTSALCDVSNPELIEPTTLQAFTDTAFLQLPCDWLEITADQIPMMITLENRTNSSIDDVQFVFNTLAENEPQISLDHNTIIPNEDILITGTNYTPNQPIEIYIDDELISVIAADPSGSFNVALPSPAGLDFGRYFLSARDTERSISDYTIVTLSHFSGDINLDHQINLDDLGFVAENWLLSE